MIISKFIVLNVIIINHLKLNVLRGFTSAVLWSWSCYLVAIWWPPGQVIVRLHSCSKWLSSRERTPDTVLLLCLVVPGPQGLSDWNPASGDSSGLNDFWWIYVSMSLVQVTLHFTIVTVYILLTRPNKVVCHHHSAWQNISLETKWIIEYKQEVQTAYLHIVKKNALLPGNLLVSIFFLLLTIPNNTKKLELFCTSALIIHRKYIQHWFDSGHLTPNQHKQIIV